MDHWILGCTSSKAYSSISVYDMRCAQVLLASSGFIGGSKVRAVVEMNRSSRGPELMEPVAAGSLAAQSLRIPGERPFELLDLLLRTSLTTCTVLRKQALYALACACLLGASRLATLPTCREFVAMVLKLCHAPMSLAYSASMIEIVMRRCMNEACYVQMSMWRGISLTVVAFARSVLEGQEGPAFLPEL